MVILEKACGSEGIIETILEVMKTHINKAEICESCGIAIINVATNDRTQA